MDPFQIKQAIQEVRHLRRNILEKQLFKGYSGRARAIGGTVALGAAMGASLLPVEMGYQSMFLMWGGVFLCAILVNYGALGVWLLKDKNHRKTDLSIVYAALPVWIVGGLLTLSLWRQFQYDLMYGCWMSLFGLAQAINRPRLPRRMVWVGTWYIACGALCLAFPGGLFMMPLVMGLVFFVGEFAAGMIMHTSNEGSRIGEFFNIGGNSNE